ncbi:MAG TPA: response regulator [Bacteroidota bacterium]|nr:response regulator [Bacteroidota bacterium]
MKTILIVDDDAAVRTMMRIVLHSNGFEVLEAENGSMALTLATERKPDLIISDVMMDNVNGFMLYELLQKEKQTKRIPFILVTGEAQKFGAWDSEKNVGYFQKPVSMHDLIEGVKKRLGITGSLEDVNRRKPFKKPR